MTYLNLPAADLKIAGGYQTALEISRQPEVWEKTAKKVSNGFEAINAFIQSAFKEVDQIILTGAGSSSFIGHSLSGILFRHFNTYCHPVPTTDIVSFPEYYFNPSHTSLIISFARSGESPESVAALELADKYNKKCFHFIITCDGSGALANYKSKNPVQVFILPAEANDKGLAMTSSYTSMLLVGLLSTLGSKDYKIDFSDQLEQSIGVARNIIMKECENLKAIAGKPFQRAVFLGSGALHGTAMEAALKLQELTSGHIICKSDTFLGFRHGPKAVINEDTLVVYFFSNNEYARQYEIDLVNSMNKGTGALFNLGIGEKVINSDQLDCQIHAGVPDVQLKEYFQPLSYILPAQMLAFFKSMQLGLSPDMPSSNGAISRVVEGVTIYPFPKNGERILN